MGEMRKCHGCGVEKDMKKLEVSPWAEEDHLTDSPVEPLAPVEVQPSNSCPGEWKEAWVCHNCFHRLDMDMWTAEWIWDAMDPLVTAFKDLPALPKKETTPGGKA